LKEAEGLTLQESYPELEFNEFEEACLEFVRSFFRKSMISIFKIHSKVAEATEKDQKKKLSKLKDQVDNNMKFFTSLYNKVTT
jgi:predicted translin family RNA/ssDNA-binding protein